MVGVPEYQTDRICAVVNSIALHDYHDSFNGRHAHYARNTTLRVAGLSARENRPVSIHISSPTGQNTTVCANVLTR